MIKSVPLKFFTCRQLFVNSCVAKTVALCPDVSYRKTRLTAIHRRGRENMKKFITDRYGQKYGILVMENSNDFFIAELRHKGEWVGTVKCTFYLSDVMVLEDIEIRNDSDPPESMVEQVLRGASSLNGETKNYRQRGLGTALLELAINVAKKKRLKYIYGSVVQKDIDRTPNLVEWYERHGFKKSSPYYNCIPSVAEYICIELD